MILKLSAYIFFGIYILALLIILLYCIIQFQLLLQYLKGKSKHQSDRPRSIPDQSLPKITVQLPVYNEPLVIGRLIDNIVKLDYPADKLQIQILDDSTDVTRTICEEKVAQYVTQGLDIALVHRQDRTGFKAGALQNGLKTSTGDLIAIFDADFLPPPDFLRRTVPYFNDGHVAVVQTRWGHLNESYSMITMMQAFQLNVHFGIEQSARSYSDHFLQFNGTAGIWRKEAIADAGGWMADTLTEDLDLSYRAQLKGWKIQYCQHLLSPAELPVEMEGLRSQQFRWMKGGAENARKHLLKVLKSNLSPAKKIHASTHLLSSSIFLVVFVLAVLSVPVLFLHNVVDINLKLLWPFVFSIVLLAGVYFVANSETSWQGKSLLSRIGRFAYLFPMFLSLSMGLSYHTSRAVIEGFRGKKSPFIRTPKFNIQGQTGKVLTASIFQPVDLKSIWMEGLLAIYFLGAVFISLWIGDYSFLIYHLMLVFGFGGIFILSIQHRMRK